MPWRTGNRPMRWSQQGHTKITNSMIFMIVGTSRKTMCFHAMNFEISICYIWLVVKIRCIGTRCLNLTLGTKKQFMQSVLLNFASERVTYVRTRRNADGPDLLID